MKDLSQWSRLSCLSLLGGALLSGTMLLTGCGLGVGSSAAMSPISSVPVQSNSRVDGILHGGPNPITGANVILWATQSNGYPSSSNDTTGTTSVQLATATTNSQGNFGFTSGSFTCPAGQFAYITATGGNSGANTNNQITLMAPLGSCSHLDNATDESNIHVYISEATTVAAAYALGNFMYVNDNGGTGNQLVYIGAPANNNAITGSCTGTSSSMTCTAAGLAHAFANAANLVDSVHYDGSMPTGIAFTAPPSNPAYGTAPAAEINALANALQSCTNSTGGTTTGACGTLFSLATPVSSTNGVGSSSGTAPVDELQAIMDIAKSPTNNVTALFNLGQPTDIFQPTLAVAPNDWSLAITYAPATTGSTLSSPIAITAYSITGNVITFTTASNTLAAGQHVLVYGFPNSTFLNGIAYTVLSSPTSTQFTANFTYSNTSGAVTENGSALYDYPVYLALDANDNVYAANQDGVNVEGGVSALASNGTPNWTNALSSSYCRPYMVATDVNGNVWMSSNQSSSQCSASTAYLISLSDSSGALTNSTPYTSATTPNGESGTAAIAFDRSSNLWIYRDEGCASGGTACIYYYKYTTGYTGGAQKITTSENSDLASGGSLLIDSNYNVWITNTSASDTGTAYLSVLPNSGSDASPAWADALISAVLPVGKNFGVAMDGTSNHNLWTGSYNGTAADLSSFTPTYAGASGDTVTATSSPTDTSVTASPIPTNPGQGEFDGLGTYWYPSNSSSGNIYYYVPSSGASIALLPCFLPAAATTCGTATSNTGTIATAGASVIQVDSAGSIWVAATTGGQIVQIIGSAAPTWPQISYATFATEPN